MAGRRQATPAADLAYVDVPAQQVKMLGSLPAVFSFCTRLGIGQAIDDLVPIRDVAAVSAGRAVAGNPRRMPQRLKKKLNK